jgi:hypothetical protein
VRKGSHEPVINVRRQHTDLTFGRELGLIDEDMAEAFGDAIIWRPNQIWIGKILVTPHFVTADTATRPVFLFVFAPAPVDENEARANLIDTDKAHNRKMTTVRQRSRKCSNGTLFSGGCGSGVCPIDQVPNAAVKSNRGN